MKKRSQIRKQIICHPESLKRFLSERIKFTFQKGHPIILRAGVEKNMFLFQQEGIPNKEDIFNR